MEVSIAKNKMPPETKPTVCIPFEKLPDARAWKVGKAYMVRMMLKQVAASERDASFEIIDATSMEPKDTKADYFVSDGGSYKKS